MQRLLIIFVFFLLLPSLSHADSIWAAKKSPYSAPKAHEVGDIITVLIEQNVSAAQEGTTSTSKAPSVGASASHDIGALAKLLGSSADSQSFNISGSGSSSFSGSGKTSRKSDIQATITVEVVDKKENGLLKVLGEHEVIVNEENQKVTLTGWIRQDDISSQNTIFSSQISQAKISFQGKGPVSRLQSPGIFTRFFDWLF